MPTWGEILKELQTTKAPGVNPLDAVRRKYLAALAQHTGRNTVLYASKWTTVGGQAHSPDMVSITAEDMQGFMEVVHGLQGSAIDVIVHLPGGSGEAAEALVKYVRSKFTDVRVIVPHAAMSAATMFACAADCIVMGKHSFLGPIDPQLIMTTEAGRTSVAAQAILDQFTRAQSECVDPKKMPSWLPILRQYGPALLVQCDNALKLSRRLVKDWLTKHMFAGDAQGAVKAEQIAAALSNHNEHHSHGRFISQADAKAMGLKIVDLESDDTLQDLVLSVFHATTHCFGATGTAKIIENHMGKAFVKVQQQIMLPAGLPLMPMPPMGPPPQMP